MTPKNSKTTTNLMTEIFPFSSRINFIFNFIAYINDYIALMGPNFESY